MNTILPRPSSARRDYAGVWSATPTPFDEALNLDRPSVRRMVNHHVQLGIRGLFLGGTAGEGMMMPDAQYRQLVHDVVRHNRGRLIIAAQVTDHSVVRVLSNIQRVQDAGADIAVVAQPLFFMKPDDRRLADYYLEIFDRSPLPVGLYDRGRHSTVPVSPALLKRLLKHPKVVLIKDSSSDPDRRAIALRARRDRPSLTLLNGDEFKTAEYMLAGYDGLLLGGAIFNGYLAGRVIAAAAEGRTADAERLDARIRRINYATFGGKSLKCWLSGQKRLCVELGIFSTWRSYYKLPLTPACERTIIRLVEREGNALRGICE